MHFLRLAYYPVLFVLFPILCIGVLYRLVWYTYPRYRYPAAYVLKKRGVLGSPAHRRILFCIRFAVLIMLALLVARPQWVDPTSHVTVDGVDIVLALDVSGSMAVFDDLSDQRSRFDVARSEAVRFIDRRSHDPIGLVLFGGVALCKCPLTLDKHILKDILAGYKLGDVSAQATVLGDGLASAINRLKNSKAKSKVIVLLTDGVPQGETISWETALMLAKKFAVKIYAVGVGRSGGGYIHDSFGHVAQVQDSLDMELLRRLAQESGGAVFRAHNPREVRSIYDTIDALETTRIETSVFHSYYEAYELLLWVVLALFALELVLRLWFLRGLSC